VPEVSVAIILASTSNMNQIVQRIGRIVRNYEGKEKALIYNVYLSDTGDVSTLKRLRRAADTGREDAYNKGRIDRDVIKKSQPYKKLDEYIF
jgi:superfamily II DNA or RNA helicase